MEKFKKALKLLFLVSLIFLACIGVGISGGVPTTSIFNRRDPEKEKTELIEEHKQDTEDKTIKELKN